MIRSSLLLLLHSASVAQQEHHLILQRTCDRYQVFIGMHHTQQYIYGIHMHFSFFISFYNNMHAIIMHLNYHESCTVLRSYI